MALLTFLSAICDALLVQFSWKHIVVCRLEGVLKETEIPSLLNAPNEHSPCNILYGKCSLLHTFLISSENNSNDS